jgi:serine/threonine protein kinase
MSESRVDRPIFGHWFRDLNPISSRPSPGLAVAFSRSWRWTASGRPHHPRPPYDWTDILGEKSRGMWIAAATGMAVAIIFDPAEIPVMLGGYQVTDLIAEGGMASLFRGWDLESGNMVALKTVRTAMAHEIAGLDREIATLRDLSHPGVVRFLASGTQYRLPWFAMELLEGRTLFSEIDSIWKRQAHRVDRTGSRRPPTPEPSPFPDSWDDSEVDPALDPHWAERLQADPALATPVELPAAGRLDEAIEHLVRLAPALDYIHGRGIVHRDLKPENVFLGTDGRTTLLDFGLACRIGDGPSDPETGDLCQGTMQYASPEQICGDRVDARADIYSLGCIMYEIVTGRPPFDGPSPELIARKHVELEPVCPSQLVSGLSYRLEDLILKMLAKEPHARPRRVGEVADDLRRMGWSGRREQRAPAIYGASGAKATTLYATVVPTPTFR